MKAAANATVKAATVGDVLPAANATAAPDAGM